MFVHKTLQAYASSNFAFSIPATYNIAQDVCVKWADGSGRLALIEEDPDGRVRRFSFDNLHAMSSQLAHAFVQHGVKPLDRVAVLLPQRVETALTHLAGYKVGATVVPLFSLFGPDAVQFRLQDSGARLLVTDRTGLAKIQQIRSALPALTTVLCVDGDGTGVLDFWVELGGNDTDFQTYASSCEHPAVLIYTSGTTGKPKGALHAHRVLLGHLPGVEVSHNGLPHLDDLFWTPADWAWIGGLLDVLLPAWHHGIPVLAHRFRKFDGLAALALMRRHRVRNVFMPPTALKQIRDVLLEPIDAMPDLRTIASGGESLGEELVSWARQVLGVEVNEFYGQTECNMVVSGCRPLFSRTPGAIGKPVPGHSVAVVDDTGKVLPVGATGQIGIQRPDPVMFLGYWNQPEATAAKFAGEYLTTGDAGFMDENGYVHYVGRTDDLITSGGYRIGPGPIEDCLLKHSAVSSVAVVGVPDKERTERVTAFVVLRPGYMPKESLVLELQDLVRSRLAAHEYPRDVHFVESLPMTTTGKVIRRALRQGTPA